MFYILPTFLHLFNIFPNTHFSRYFILYYSVIFYIFSYRILPFININIIIVLWIILFSVSLMEYKKRDINEIYDVRESIESLSNKGIIDKSNYLIDKLKITKFPVNIALQEVQIRGMLDSRFNIWSLDGITDDKLANYLHRDYIDHFSYLKFRKVDYIFGLQNYNNNKQLKSLNSFLPLDGNKSKCINGLYIEETDIFNIYKLKKCNE